MNEERSQEIGSEEAKMPIASGTHEWREMVAGDLPRVLAIADKCHPDHPEDEAVFRERLALFPTGCSVLENDGHIVGYLICHPYLFGRPVDLNSLLGKIPSNTDVIYIHDVSIDLGMRGHGLASDAVSRVQQLAWKSGFRKLALVAVNHSQPFWEGHGFVSISDDLIDQALSRYGIASSYMVCELERAA